MREMEWSVSVEDCEAYNKGYCDRPWAAEIKRYYGGFRGMKMEPKYKEELEDLEKVYVNALENIEGELGALMPIFLAYMDTYVGLHTKRKALTEKLELLRAKLETEKEEIDHE